MWRVLVPAGIAIGSTLLLLLPVDAGVSTGGTTKRVSGLDLAGYSSEPPPLPIDVLFLHHSVGAQLLASPGPEHGDPHQPSTHPNGGGLRVRLDSAGYRLHSATYGSELGEHTDLFDWLPKYRGHMDEVLVLANQDTRLPDGNRNRVVIFKSCFPNSNFSGIGTEPGNPGGPDLTVANARATMNALLPEFAKHPDVLFVYLTSPPMAPGPETQPAWKWLAKKVLGRQPQAMVLQRSGDLAREFNNWVRKPDGWLRGYSGRNVVVFDLFDTLTGHGRSNLSVYATWGGADSHPSAEGNALVADEFVPFLNRAVRYAGLAQ
jgi:hypothetical protein